MRGLWFACWLLVASAARADVVELGGQRFTLPEGFEIERVAGPPLVDRPITADFDEQGRLYVADSSGSNDKVEKQLAERPHRIVRLEDVDGDGRFDRSVVFAERMMFPEGTMWLDGSLYVATPPSIWKLTDTDGDGRADRREEWFQGKTLTGCANDLHGPYRGPDGWIYWCKGAFAEQTYPRPGRKPLVTRAAHIFRARRDGTGIEPVMTGGMDNPVDVVFTPGGERILSGTFFVHPGGGQRDGLIHAVYGGVYGKDHDVLAGHPRTGELMPVMTHLGPAAACGLASYEAEAFGAEYRDNLFCCLFNLHKVTRHVLVPHGATFQTRDEDFVLSDNVDFHPTDVLADADGSLVIVDTGGWYKLCCPTSQLSKPDVLGAIYRVRRRGAARPDDPRGQKIAWHDLASAKLLEQLGDARPAVRERALETLPRRPDAVEAIRAGRAALSPLARRGAVWALTRIDSPAARAAVREALQHDRDALVRQAALHSISLWRDQDAVLQLVLVSRYAAPPLRRAAMEALGRSHALASWQSLGDRAAADDRVLEHSAIFAMIEIGDALPDAKFTGPRTEINRAALIALDQMDPPRISTAAVVDLLSAQDPSVRQTAHWIVGHRTDSAARVEDWFVRRWTTADLTDEMRGELETHAMGLVGRESVQRLLGAELSADSLPRERLRRVLKLMARSPLKQLPASWIEPLERLLLRREPTLVDDAISVVRVVPAVKDKSGRIGPSLLSIAGDEQSPVARRLAALAALPAGTAELEPGLFDLLLAHLPADQESAARAAAVEALAKAKLERRQLSAVAAALPKVSPLDVERLLAAFDQTTDAELGLALVESLKQSPALPGLHVEVLKPRLARFGPAVDKKAEELFALIHVGAAEQRAELERRLAGLPKGEVRRGQLVFKSEKASCTACHAIGYLGGKIGPDLTRIGSIRTERDLLEALLFPSASFVRSYEPWIVATDAGKVYSGLLKKNSPEEVTLTIDARQEVTIPRGEIEVLKPGTVSVMPAGLDKQFTPQELADLVAFLKAAQ